MIMGMGARWSRLSALCGFVAGMTFAACSPGWATPTFVVAAGACPTTPADCTATNGVVVATALDPVLVGPFGQPLRVFASAFDAWDNSLPAGSKWTLDNLLGPGNGGPLSDQATITVTTDQAFVQTRTCNGDIQCGGDLFMVDYTPGPTDPPSIVDPANIGAADAVWTQDIFTNQKSANSLPGNPYLDNPPGIAGAQLGPPAYPFQSTGSSFFDSPSRDAYAYWYGVAWLSTVDYTTRDLTLYSGVAWGFTVVAVPEPSTVALLGVGAALILSFGRRVRPPAERRPVAR